MNKVYKSRMIKGIRSDSLATGKLLSVSTRSPLPN
jgi:hypothetical protein